MPRRFALLSLTLVACDPRATRVDVRPAPDRARAAALALGARGNIDRAVNALAVLDASDPATQADTEVEEVTWLADLSRCKAARATAARMTVTSLAAAHALAECDGVTQPASPAALAEMRVRFHDAVAVEKLDPARAIALYESAWAAAPTGAIMLGLARAARAKGDAALAEGSFERALGWAEREGDPPRLVVGAPHLSERIKNGLVEDDLVGIAGDSAFFDVEHTDSDETANGRSYLVRDDLKSGAVTVVVPESAIAVSAHYALVKGRRGALLFQLGIDDLTTARGLPALDRATRAAFSPSEKLLIAELQTQSSTGAVLLDLETGRELWRDAESEEFQAFMNDGSMIVQDGDRVPCVISAPAWNLCEDLPSLSLLDGRAAALNGDFLVLSTDRQLTIYDLAAKHVKARFHGHFASVSSVAISHDGRYVLSRSESRMVQWTVATGARAPAALIFYDAGVAFSRDGKYLVNWGVNSGSIDVYDATRLPALEPESVADVGQSLGSVDLLRDGRFVTIGAATALVDVRSSTVTHFPFPCVENPDGQRVACGDLTLQRATADDGTRVTTSRDGTYVVLDPKTASTTFAVGADASIETMPAGRSRIGGNAASIACRVGDVWLPLDACRDRLVDAL